MFINVKLNFKFFSRYYRFGSFLCRSFCKKSTSTVLTKIIITNIKIILSEREVKSSFGKMNTVQYDTTQPGTLVPCERGK